MSKILVIGDAILDIYVYGSVNRVSPEDPTISILDYKNSDYRLGGCLNVAANLKSLDSSNEIYALSIIEKRCNNLLSLKDICNLSFVRSEEDCIVKTRFVDEQRKKQLMRLDNRLKFEDIHIEEISDFLKYVNFSNLDVIIVSDYQKGIVNSVLLDKLKNNDPNTAVFVDTKNPDLSVWNEINNCVIKVNHIEYSKRKKNTIHPLVVTTGSKGAMLIENGKETAFPTKSVKDPEVTGAGDVFICGLTIKYLATNDLQKSIKYANLVARKSVKSFGTTEVK